MAITNSRLKMDKMLVFKQKPSINAKLVFLVLLKESMVLLVFQPLHHWLQKLMLWTATQSSQLLEFQLHQLI